MPSEKRRKIFFFFFFFASIFFMSFGVSATARLLYQKPASGLMVEKGSLGIFVRIQSPAANRHPGPVPAANLGT